MIVNMKAYDLLKFVFLHFINLFMCVIHVIQVFVTKVVYITHECSHAVRCWSNGYYTFAADF